jgi:hypothetical protein
MTAIGVQALPAAPSARAALSHRSVRHLLRIASHPGEFFRHLRRS